MPAFHDLIAAKDHFGDVAVGYTSERSIQRLQRTQVRQSHAIRSGHRLANPAERVGARRLDQRRRILHGLPASGSGCTTPNLIVIGHALAQLAADGDTYHLAADACRQNQAWAVRDECFASRDIPQAPEVVVMTRLTSLRRCVDVDQRVRLRQPERMRVTGVEVWINK